MDACQARSIGLCVVAAAVILSSAPAVFTPGPAGQLAPPNYIVTDLGSLGGGESRGLGINGSGEVVGESWRASGDYHAFLWSGGRMLDLGSLGGNSSASGINDRGDVVGSFRTGSDGKTSHAFLYQRGRMLDLGPPNQSSWAEAINNRGEIAGFVGPGRSDEAHAAVWHRGRWRDLGTLPGGTWSWALGLNDRGDVVGMSSTRGRNLRHAFVSRGGRLLDLGTLGGANSRASAVNADGLVAGSSEFGAAAPQHAFLWKDGRMEDLGSLRAEGECEPYAINKRGDMVGTETYGHPFPAAFVYREGVMHPLSSLITGEWKHRIFIAVGTNDRGQIVGSGLDRGQWHALLLTPDNDLSHGAPLAYG